MRHEAAVTAGNSQEITGNHRKITGNHRKTQKNTQKTTRVLRYLFHLRLAFVAPRWSVRRPSVAADIFFLCWFIVFDPSSFREITKSTDSKVAATATSTAAIDATATDAVKVGGGHNKRHKRRLVKKCWRMEVWQQEHQHQHR